MSVGSKTTDETTANDYFEVILPRVIKGQYRGGYFVIADDDVGEGYTHVYRDWCEL